MTILFILLTARLVLCSKLSCRAHPKIWTSSPLTTTQEQTTTTHSKDAIKYLTALTVFYRKLTQMIRIHCLIPLSSTSNSDFNNSRKKESRNKNKQQNAESFKLSHGNWILFMSLILVSWLQLLVYWVLQKSRVSE